MRHWSAETRYAVPALETIYTGSWSLLTCSISGSRRLRASLADIAIALTSHSYEKSVPESSLDNLQPISCMFVR